MIKPERASTVEKDRETSGEHTLALTVGACGALGVFAIGVNLTGPALDTIARGFHLPMERTGLLFSLVMVGLLVGVLTGGVLSDFFGPKAVALTGLTVLSLGLCAFALGYQFPFALVSMALVGFAGGLIMGFINPLMATLYPEGAARALNGVHAVYPGCALIAAAGMGAWLDRGLSWRGPYWAAALMALALTPLFRHCRKPGTSGQAIRPRDVPGLAKSLRFWHFAAMMVLAMGAESGISGMLGLYAVRELSFTPKAAGGVLSFFWLGMMAGRLLTATLTRRFPLVVLIALCPAGAAISWAGVVWGGGRLSMAAFLVATGLCHAGTFPLILAYARNWYSQVYGSASGSLISVGTLGGMLAPYLVGVVGARLGLRLAVGSIALLEVGVMALALGLVVRNGLTTTPSHAAGG